MNVETISMDKDAALAAFRSYRDAVKQNRRDRRLSEDKAAMQAMKAASKGQALLDLNDVMKQAGVFDSGYPKLAIIRADQEFCWCVMRENGAARFAPSRDELWDWGRRPARTLTRDVPPETFPSRRSELRGSRAVVPTVPPHLQPRHALSNYFILWEAVWEPQPPVDPMLLKHLGGALYAVLAAWDLTAIERAVLKGRLTA